MEWAEVCYVPNAIGHSKKGPEYRYLAKREVLDRQQEFPDMDRQTELPFPTMDIKNQTYKFFGVVTNMDWEGEELIHWFHERCGKSEDAHAVMKKVRTKKSKTVYQGRGAPKKCRLAIFS